MKNCIVFIIFLFLFIRVGFSQEKDSLAEPKEIQYDESTGLKPVKFDDSKIENYRTQKEFDYINTAEKDTWWTRFKKWINAKYNQFINWLFGDYSPGSILGFIIKIIPFLLLFLLLGIVAWLFSRLNPGGNMLKSPKLSEVFLSEEEELIKNEDLSALMKEAIQNKDFRLAVRYYYLRELRKLDQLQLIDYEYQKTNRDYSEEIKNVSIQKQFADITKIYEFIWYGSFKVSEHDFHLAEKGFLRLDQTLKSEHS